MFGPRGGFGTISSSGVSAPVPERRRRLMRRFFAGTPSPVRHDSTRPPPPPSGGLKYARVLLKLSGEALCNPSGTTEAFGIQPQTLKAIAEELAEVHALGVQLGLVIGGGNIFRGLK